MKRFIQGVTVFLITALIATTFTYSFVKRTITKGEKQDNQIASTWGYKLEKWIYQDKFQLPVWKYGREGQWYQTYYVPEGEWNTPELLEERWLGNGRAIYLNLKMTMDVTGGMDYVTDSVKIIYDFNEGEMYISSSLPIWRGVGVTDNYRKNFMFEADFQEKLKSLE